MKNLKELFSRKRSDAPRHNQAPPAKLDLGMLDHCVGGRIETDDVGCYLRSTQPPA
jgi:hypothetical protein